MMAIFQYDNVKGVTTMIVTLIFQYDNVEGVTILLPADDQDISIQVQGIALLAPLGALVGLDFKVGSNPIHPIQSTYSF